MWSQRFIRSAFTFAYFFLCIGATWAQPVATDPTKEPFEKAVQTLQSLKADLTDLKSRMSSEFKGVELRTQTRNSGIQVYTLTQEQAVGQAPDPAQVDSFIASLTQLRKLVQDKKQPLDSLLLDSVSTPISAWLLLHRGNVAEAGLKMQAVNAWSYPQVKRLNEDYARIVSQSPNQAPTAAAQRDQGMRKLFQETALRVRAINEGLNASRCKYGRLFWWWADFGAAKSVKFRDSYSVLAQTAESLIVSSFGPDMPLGQLRTGFGECVAFSPFEGASYYESLPFPDVQDPKQVTVLRAGNLERPTVQELRQQTTVAADPWDIIDTRVLRDDAFSKHKDFKPQPNTYTLFLYGHRLPMKKAQLASLESTDKGIELTPITWGEAVQPNSPSLDTLMWTTGWQQALSYLKPLTVQKLKDNGCALLVRAKVTPGVLPGWKRIKVNGVSSQFYLHKGTVPAQIRLARELPPDLDIPRATPKYEPTSLLYSGKRFVVEVELSQAAPLDKIAVNLFGGSALLSPVGADSWTAVKVPGSDRLYRTELIELVSEDDPRLAFSRPQNASPALCPLPEGQHVGATVADRSLFTFPPDQAVATASTLDPSDGEWMLAFRRVVRMAGRNTMDPARMSNQQVAEVSNFQLTQVAFMGLEAYERMLDVTGTITKIRKSLLEKVYGNGDLAKGKVVSRVSITLGDHASLLVLRRAFIASMEQIIEHFPNPKTPAEWDTYRLSLEQSLKAKPSAMGYIMVPAPPTLAQVYNPGSGSMVDNALLQEVPLKYAFDPIFLGKAYNRQAAAKRTAWVDSSVRFAFTRYRAAVEAALKKAKETKEDDPVKLMELVGNGFGPVVEFVVPRLMRRKVDPVTGVNTWVPDVIGRGSVRGVGTTFDAIQAQHEYTELDRSTAIAVAGLVPIGTPAGVARILASTTFNSVVFANAALRELPAYKLHESEYTFALGAAAVIGTQRLDLAEAQRVPSWPIMMNLALAGVGLSTDAIQAMGLVTKFEAARTAGRLVSKLSKGGFKAFKELPPAEQGAFLNYVSGAELAETVKAGDLSLLEKDALKTWRQMAEETAQIRGKTPGIPELELPGNNATGTRAFAVFGEPNPTAAVIPRPGEVWVDIKGIPHTIGKRIGAESAFAQVYRLEGTKKVIKFFRGHEIKEVSQAERAALKAKFLEKNPYWPANRAMPDITNTNEGRQILADMRQASRLLDQEKIPQLTIREFVAEADTPYVIQDLLEEGPNSLFGTSAAVFDMGKRYKPEFQHAFLRMAQKMVKSKLVWDDGHAGNIYFFRASTEAPWECGILDQDFIVPFGETKGRVGSRLQQIEDIGHNAYGMRSIRGINLHDGPTRPAYIYPSSEFWMETVLDAKGWLEYEGTATTGRFTDGKLDLEIVKKYFPNIEKRAFVTTDGLYEDAVKAGVPMIPR